MAEKKGQSLEEQSLEEIFSDLEQTIKKMEEGEISLEESFQLYHQGMDHQSDQQDCNGTYGKFRRNAVRIGDGRYFRRGGIPSQTYCMAASDGRFV